MERYSKEQRVFIVEQYFKNNEGLAATVRNFRTKYGRDSNLNSSTVKRLIKKFRETGSISDLKHSGRPSTSRSAQNIDAVRESLAESPGTSIRHRCQELGISRSSLQRILTKDLHLHDYKIELTQELDPSDHTQRREFVEWIMEQQQLNTDFSNKIIFSNEAHFHLDGFVNRQNCRIWGSEDPRVIVEKQMHSQRVTVWCGFWSGGIIGPFFFENASGQAITVDGARYHDMIIHYFIPKLQNINTDDMWFQQDDAICHTARETIQLLHGSFPGRVISRFGDRNWPPRSCDLTPLDFFLWGFLKSKVYANKPTTIHALKEEIKRCIKDIQPHLCRTVIEDFNKRVRMCQQSHGGHLSDIVLYHVT
ncbi:hypothetical protein PV328_004759 [Microctonus aethiopoides]|uniref:DUF4817 domain-containing protein n=1 Tax=Microctonus aethiopoides TaxID=144406 RepID=A0AA39FBA9_9HYME|nr:hypothetical protein PV328_004759 [Microctonus aethiopoides]